MLTLLGCAFLGLLVMGGVLMALGILKVRVVFDRDGIGDADDYKVGGSD